jgi:AcrR family transcriptional regulator
MKKGQDTRDLLQTHARRLFWSKGYSNVSVREVAKAAGVDVALIARYFGSKLGLFEATLDTLKKIDPDDFSSVDSLVNVFVEMFSNAPKEGTEASPISMILLNANDSDVGTIVARIQYEYWQSGLEKIIGSKSQAALFFAAMMGFSVGQKILHLDGIAELGSDEYRAQFRHMLTTAIASPDF